MDNQQHQLGNGALSPIKNPHKLTNSFPKVDQWWQLLIIIMIDHSDIILENTIIGK